MSRFTGPIVGICHYLIVNY